MDCAETAHGILFQLMEKDSGTSVPHQIETVGIEDTKYTVHLASTSIEQQSGKNTREGPFLPEYNPKKMKVLNMRLNKCTTTFDSGF